MRKITSCSRRVSHSSRICLSQPSPTTPSLHNSKVLKAPLFKVFSKSFLTCFTCFVSIFPFVFTCFHITCRSSRFPNWGPETNCVPEMCSFVSPLYLRAQRQHTCQGPTYFCTHLWWHFVSHFGSFHLGFSGHMIQYSHQDAWMEG